jgi:hypothetical protein
MGRADECGAAERWTSPTESPCRNLWSCSCITGDGAHGDGVDGVMPLDTSFFCLDFQPKANGFSDVGQGPASMLQEPAQQREADDHLMPQQRPRTNCWG